MGKFTLDIDDGDFMGMTWWFNEMVVEWDLILKYDPVILFLDAQNSPCIIFLRKALIPHIFW